MGMAQTDVNLIFTGSITGAPQAITNAAVRSTGILDLATGTMVTSGTFIANNSLALTHGNAPIFGEDIGLGVLRMPIMIQIGAAFTGGTSLNIQLQGAIDTGGTTTAVSGLTWNTYAESGAQPLAVLGQPNVNFPFPDMTQRALAALGQNSLLPRFISLNYVPVGTFTAGTISFAGLMYQRPDFTVGYYPSGFSVGP